MNIYVVVEPDPDPSCGTWIIGVFSTKDKAEDFVKTTDCPSEKTIEEWILDSDVGRTSEL